MTVISIRIIASQNSYHDYESTLQCLARVLRCLELHICIYIYRYGPLDNRYGFSISIGNTKNYLATLSCLEGHTPKIC